MSAASAACAPSLRTLGLTGGIGAGKSYVCRLLRERGLPVFGCDEQARRIMATDPQVRRELVALAGPAVYDERGQLCKPVLSDYLRQGGDHACRVNAVVHPRVAQAFRQWAARVAAERPASAQERPLVAVMECALLFEAGFHRLVSASCCVEAPLEVRLQRVCARDGIRRATARQWVELQMSQEEKLRRADYRLLNDGVAPLAPQLDALLEQVAR